MNLSKACKIALDTMPGYYITSASETEDGWLFSFSSEDGEIPDELPLLISKTDGSVLSYNYEEYFMEIMNAEPISLSKLEL